MFDLLSEIGKLRVKLCGSPMVPSIHHTREGETFKDLERYRRLVGKLNNLKVTRLDIVHSVKVVSQYMSTPTIDHWVVVEHIPCYLKGALRCGILYSNHGYNRIVCLSEAY